MWVLPLGNSISVGLISSSAFFLVGVRASSLTMFVEKEWSLMGPSRRTWYVSKVVA